MTTDPGELDPELTALFWSELGRGCAAGGRAQRKLAANPLDPEARKEIKGFFHRLAGDAGVVGLPFLSSLGLACEALADREPSPGEAARASRVFEGALARLAAAAKEHEGAPRPGSPAIPEVALASLASSKRESRGHVLIVDDDPFAARMMESALSLAGFDATWADSGTKALAQIDASTPDLLLVDVLLPDIDGFELCRKLRAKSMFEIVPIIFVTARGDVEERIRGLTVGGNDYMVKPFDPRELVARVATHLQRIASLREMAIRDGLTRCYNHKYFKLRLGEELSRAHRAHRVFSVAMLDIDHFKAVNDVHGHLTGDAVLSELANVVMASVRSIDLVARYGGEEFSLLLADTQAKEAAVLASRIRERVERYPFRTPGDDERPPLRVTVSIGLAEAGSLLEPPDEILARVDRALYAAKESGRNRIVVAEPS